MADPKGLVFSGRDNSGAAVVFPDRKPLTEDLVSIYKKKATEDDDTKLTDSALKSLSADIGKAWSIDFEELQEDYETKLIPKMKEYENTKNKAKRRELWYEVNAEVGRLKNKVRKSQQTERQFLKQANDIKADTKGAYIQDEAWNEMEKYTKQKIDDRPDTPGISKATMVSAVDWLGKNTEYSPKVKTWKKIQSDGTYKQGTRVVLDQKELEQAIRATIPTMPQNQRNVLMKDTWDQFVRTNPTALSDPPDVQARKFEQFVVDQVYNSMEMGIKQKVGDVVSLKKTDGNNINFNFGAGAATSGKAIYYVQKADDQGTYKINIQDTGTKSPAENKVMEWQISGKEYKQITGDTSAKISDDEIMTIKGRLAYVQVNEDKGLRPMLGIVYEEIVDPGGPPMFSGDQKEDMMNNIAQMFAKKVKRGQVVQVEFMDENKAKVLEYGADPVDIYKQKRAEADELAKTNKPKSPKPARQKGSSLYDSTQSKPGETFREGTTTKKPTKGKLY